jgi:hypothetical protein
MKTYWFGLLVSALLFFSVGYCVRDWIPERSEGIRVVELDRRTAENLMENVREP